MNTVRRSSDPDRPAGVRRNRELGPTTAGSVPGTGVQIRSHRPSDTDPIVALSLRAWAPVFDSMLAMVSTQ